MTEFKVLSSAEIVTSMEMLRIADFLFDNLLLCDDNKAEILKAIEYALSRFPHQGGFVITNADSEGLAGVVVINKTGMDGFFPENLLIYIAARKGLTDDSIINELVRRSKEFAKGRIGLKCHHESPLIPMFEKFGFATRGTYMSLKRT